ncbi:MAG: N-acetyl-gamma-glutamyl-phosphate reductase [Ruminococcaceae bacterium]|nr:N-acetyl-gamma-glutamyl-phosphate reductase [Oscillospiraceae bacterium]
MMTKIFVDGSQGTTGLRIFDRLSEFKDIELITLPEELRKDKDARKEALNSADVAFLCLPDDAARESVSLIENENTVVIDTSTAHRTLDDWAYGFPELSQSHREKLKSSKRIAVPGCHASGFIALVYPLIEAGAIDEDILLSCFSLTGYSGGGKKMIAEYEEEPDVLLEAPRQYALGQTHKHLKEMVKISGINNAPVFCPVVSSFYSGMEVTVPLFKEQLKNGFTFEKIKALYKEKYNSELVKYQEDLSEGGFISAGVLSGKDNMIVSVFGNDDRIILTARYDNLGKGASGAAIECLNIVLGNTDTQGLEV